MACRTRPCSARRYEDKGEKEEVSSPQETGKTDYVKVSVCPEIKVVALQMQQMHRGLRHSLSLWVTLHQLHKHLRENPRVATEICDHLHPARSKAGAVRRDLQKMWRQLESAMTCSCIPALLLLVFGELGMLWGAGNHA